MKIVIFLPIFWPERNGLINYVVGLYGKLLHNKPDLDLTVITFDFNHENKFTSKEGDFVIYRIPCYVLLGGTYVIPTLKGCRKFWSLLSKEKFDLVNTHTRFFISSLMGLILAKKQDVPLVHTEHGSSFVRDGSWFTRFVARVYDETLGRLVVSFASRLVGVSQSCVDFAYRLGGKNGTVIYNGIDTEFWRTEERMPTKVPNITFCGRMVKGKGVQNLLLAMEELKEFEWHLHLVGDGNYINKLKEMANYLEINKRIIWHGDQDRIYLRSILAKTDIFVNPSYTEGLPTSVLEAGAMRCAIVATNVGGTNEIIENSKNGLLIPAPVGDLKLEPLVKSLSILLGNPIIQRKYGNTVSENIKNKFSWEVISKKFSLQVFEDK